MTIRKALFIGVLFSFVVSPCWSLTLSDIRTQIRRHVRDTATDTTLQRYSDSVLNGWINEAQRDFVNRTWCLQNSQSITLTVNTTYYDLSDDLIAIIGVRFEETSLEITELEEKAERSFRQEFADYERSNTGQPTEYFVRYSTFSADPLEISFQPTPTTTASTGTATVQYYSQANDISSDTEVPFDGFRHLYPYHEALVYYVSGKIKLIQGLYEEAKAYNGLYETSVAIALDRMGRLPNYNPGFSVKTQ